MVLPFRRLKDVWRLGGFRVLEISSSVSMTRLRDDIENTSSVGDEGVGSCAILLIYLNKIENDN